MKTIFLIIFSGICLNAFSQTDKPVFRLRLDTCLHSPAIKGESGIPGIVVYIANGIIVNVGELDPDLIKDLEILRCPKGYIKYGHIGAGAVVDIITTQVLDSLLLTQADIQKAAGVKGEVIFAVNCLLLKDPDMKFSKKAILETEVITIPGIDDPAKKKTCINIWTREKSSRAKFF